MEVDDLQFWPQLLPILRSISNATFVAIDLEMSGISIRRYGVDDRSHSTGKPSLQQQYEETKAAAEKYQILQVGITCVEEDRDREMYVARPYNLNVTPLFAQGDRLDINRDITLSSSAIQFLIKNHFDVGAVFKKGVPYLSREEETFARKNYAKRQDNSSSIPNIVIPENDAEALKFYDRAKKSVGDWADAKKPELDFINIGAPNGLNGFQRRLIHQLVRTEFPGYRTFSRNNGEFMQIEKIDPEREANIMKSRLQSFESALVKQIGVRFIFEALARGDLSSIDPKWFCVAESGAPAFVDLEAKTKEIQELQTILRTKSHAIVGHNLFTDLIFIYKMFTGSLPDKVADFNQHIHALFPQVIDTKYLATYEGGSMRTNSNLKDLHDGLREQKMPFIYLAEKHTDYGLHGKEHEAGYDSWMTAQVLVKLSAKLAAAREATESESEELVYSKPRPKHGYESNVINPPDTNGIRTSTKPISIISMNHRDPTAKDNRDLKISAMPLSTRKTNVNFFTGSIFDQLNVEGADDGESSVSSSPERGNGGVLLKAREASLMDDDIDDRFRVVSNHQAHLKTQLPSRSASASPKDDPTTIVSDGISRYWHAAQLNKFPSRDPNSDEPDQWIPKMDSSFWKMFANRLRVYGTETEVCCLDD